MNYAAVDRCRRLESRHTLEQFTAEANVYLSRSSVIALLGVTLSVATLAVVKAGESDDFREVQREFRIQLRSKQPEQRIEALVKLREHPVVAAATLVVKMGLADRVDAVRASAHESLLEMNQNKAVCKYLLTTLKKDFRQKGQPRTSEVLLDVLLSSGVPETREQLEPWLDREINPQFLQRLAKQSDLAAVELLQKLSETELFVERFAFRRALIHALIQSEQPEAVDVLIELLDLLQGESRVDIVVYLRSISLENTGINANAWRSWWKDHRDVFEFPPMSQRARNVSDVPLGGEDGSYSRYYGLSIYAKRVVFVIDASTSMEGMRLDAAKRELLGAIEQLPPDTEFAVVAYNSRAWAWQQQLQVASRPAKENAAGFISGLKAAGLTASYDALAAAFGYDAEAMYFLSDGVPTTGRITDPPHILQAIGELNRGRYLSIYTIGIQAGAEGLGFARFLKLLAKQNAGQFREVNR